jgi:hypothetical protein
MPHLKLFTVTGDKLATAWLTIFRGPGVDSGFFIYLPLPFRKRAYDMARDDLLRGWWVMVLRVHWRKFAPPKPGLNIDITACKVLLKPDKVQHWNNGEVRYATP